ncbi:MAG: hypothetical protein RLZZ562_617 [Planctomycetota bacterium]|jgi:hypothetical protein
MKRFVANFARWLCHLIGGVLLGAGLVLHGQIAFIRLANHEVDRTFFLWRLVGEATVYLQSLDVQVALALQDIPENVLRESDLAAWTLVIVGTLMVLAALVMPRPKAKGK